MKVSALLLCLASSYAMILASPLGNGSRLLGGQDAERGQFKHLVSIQFAGAYISTGSIIAPRWVLTEATRLERLIEAPSPVDVVAGVLYAFEDHPDIQYKTMDLGILHPEHNEYNNDIGLIRVNSPFTFNDAIQPIQLNCNPEDLARGDQVLTAGWGYTTVEGGANYHLQYLDMSLTTNAECQAILEDRAEIREEMVCALPALEGQGSCNYDEGNPLVHSSGTLVGVKNKALELCGTDVTPQIPNVFVRVSSHLHFIVYGTGEEFCGLTVSSTSTSTVTPPVDSTTKISSTSSSGTTATESEATPDNGFAVTPSTAVLLVCFATSMLHPELIR